MPNDNNERRIVSAHISPMPKRLLDPLPKVLVNLDDGSQEVLFSYYPDEISFTPGEFIGLTVSQGRKLKYDKDLKYLQS